MYVGVDVGGTKVLAGEVDERGRVVRTALRRTPGPRASIEALEAALSEAVAEVAGDRELRGVGLAAAGFVDAEGERVVFAPHLPWVGEPVRAQLAARWGVPVALDNDANCAALAETVHGAARRSSSALVITLGTGIGGAIVLDGRVVRGAHGMAGEFGHMQVVPDGHACECGHRGCWEQYSSGNALVRLARPSVALSPRLAALCGDDPDRLTGPMVTAAALEGDPAANEAFVRIGDWLGVGVGGRLVAAFDPELVVIGGGVSAAGDLLLGPARTALARSLVGGRHRVVPDLVEARLGPESGMVGAALLARGRRLGEATDVGWPG